jgi:hypothetical protein
MAPDRTLLCNSQSLDSPGSMILRRSPQRSAAAAGTMAEAVWEGKARQCVLTALCDAPVGRVWQGICCDGYSLAHEVCAIGWDLCEVGFLLC